MKLNPFQKTKDKNRADEKPENSKQCEVVHGELENKTNSVSSLAFLGSGGILAHRVLKGFYVSEKASLGNTMGQYVFRVSKNANKPEIKKEISKLFSVKVKNVKILNMPEKRRDLGRHPGAKTGFKKAIVVLEEGYTINQAKA